MDEDKATFFDRIYPELSMRIHQLESDRNLHLNMILGLREQVYDMNNCNAQYKNKVKKIEQMLIKAGLLHLLKGDKNEQNEK